MGPGLLQAIVRTSIFLKREKQWRILKRNVAYVCRGPPSYPGGIRATEVIAMIPTERRCWFGPTGGSRGLGTQSSRFRGTAGGVRRSQETWRTWQEQQSPLLRKPEHGAGRACWRGFGNVEPGVWTTKGWAWCPREESRLETGTEPFTARGSRGASRDRGHRPGRPLEVKEAGEDSDLLFF